MFFLILAILALNIKTTYGTVYEHFYGKTIREYNVFKDIANKIKNGVMKAINKLKDEVNKIKDQIVGIFNKIEDAFNEISSVLLSIPKRLSNIEKGFRLSMEAIGEEVENLGKGLGLGFTKTFDLIGESGSLTINAMECGIDKINYLPQCFPVYIFDMIIYFNKLIFKSIMNAVDLYIGFKRNFGIDIQQSMNYFYDTLMYLDKILHHMTGFHFMNYPDFILNRCYRCRQSVDTEKIINKSKEVNKAFNEDLPRMLNEPIAKFKDAQRSFEDAFS